MPSALVALDIRRYLRPYWQRALERWGYRLQKTTPLDMRGAATTPRDSVLEHARTLCRGLLVDVPFSRCRTSTGTAFDERHPFVVTVAAGLPDSYGGSLLEDYYEANQPETAVEVLGLSPDEAPGYAEQAASAYVLPWSRRRPHELLVKREHWMRTAAVQYGEDLTLEDGFTFYGPVSEAKGALEMRRLAALYRSMSRDGFRRSGQSDGDVTGRLLTEETGDWCVLITSGQHRSAVAAGLGFRSIPVRITSAPIKKEEAMYWPQVTAGRVTPGGARKVFDRLMRGNPPPSFSPPRMSTTIAEAI